jgi:hypothetical protein
MRLVVLALLAAGLALLAAGCGNSPHPIMPGDVQVELGTTALDGTGFAPLEGDQTLVPGAQGGFHVWVKWKIEGMAQEKVHIARTVRRLSDGELILTAESAQEVGEPASDGWWMMAQPVPSFMCPTPIGVSVEDQAMKFELTVKTDDNGEPGEPLAETSATATPRCPTDSNQEFCQNICNG